MGYLLVTSVIWAFSFGLIKRYLAGVDPSLVAFLRLAVSLLLFLPLLRLKKVNLSLATRLTLIGAIQYGVMYLAYIAAFRFLQGHEVALYTVFTPLFVVLVDDVYDRRLRLVGWLAASLAVVGTILVVYSSAGLGNFLAGFVLVQVSNLAFAFGQVAYARLGLDERGIRQSHVFGLLYLGGAVVAGLAVTLFSTWQVPKLDHSQWLSLFYLAVIASGIGFFLWNKGATLVKAPVLAVFNNLKVPLAVVAALLIFGEPGDPLRLLAGGLLILLAFWIGIRAKT